MTGSSFNTASIKSYALPLMRSGSINSSILYNGNSSVIVLGDNVGGAFRAPGQCRAWIRRGTVSSPLEAYNEAVQSARARSACVRSARSRCLLADRLDCVDWPQPDCDRVGARIWRDVVRMWMKRARLFGIAICSWVYIGVADGAEAQQITNWNGAQAAPTGFFSEVAFVNGERVYSPTKSTHSRPC
jgi:hypothetical protein